MANPRTQVSSLLSELITKLTGLSPASAEPTETKNFNLAKDFTIRTLRAHKSPAPNPFAISSSLHGLIEKLQIKNKDPLAEALSSRVSEIEAVQRKNDGTITSGDVDVAGGDVHPRYIPDILHLLLSLSDLPAENSDTVLRNLETLLEKRKDAEEEREKQIQEELAQEERDRKRMINGDDDDDDDEGIWAIPDFGATSSEDSDWNMDDFQREVEIARKKKGKRSNKKDGKAQDGAAAAGGEVGLVSSVNLDDYIRVAHAAATQSVELAQYWGRQKLLPIEVAHDFVSYGFTTPEVEEMWVVNELQVVREVIFALYGVPCSLFTFQENGSINVCSHHSTNIPKPQLY